MDDEAGIAERPLVGRMLFRCEDRIDWLPIKMGQRAIDDARANCPGESEGHGRST